MCTKWWHDLWHSPDPVVPVTIADRRLFTFGKNLYSGGNSLNGCWNDSLNLSRGVLDVRSDFAIWKYRDYDVIAKTYLSTLDHAVSTFQKGGTFLMMADSCFSETFTKMFGCAAPVCKSRFYDLGFTKKKVTKRLMGAKENMNYIAMSGCMEHQTCADYYCETSSQYEGAFTHYAVATLKSGITYREWFEAIKKGLKDGGFEQIPTIEGPEYLINRKVFEDPTTIFHNSSHGSYVPDKNGDESDGVDEVLYFDVPVLDDEIGQILSKL
jgi:hypothetical protein